MRVWPAVLVAALAASACAQPRSESGDPPEPAPAGGAGPAGQGSSSSGTGGGSVATGGSPGTGGSADTGGSPGASGGAGAAAGGAGGSGDPGKDAADPTTPPGGNTMTGGKAMLIVGTIPLLGTDVQFEAALKARGLEVEIIQEKTATPAMAVGRKLIMMSYSMSSTAFNAEPFTDVPVPVIVTEHNLLSRIKMASQHGFTASNLTKITIISGHELAGGFPMGDVEVYLRQQEMFWGIPSPAAISIAHITGQPTKITYFAYEKGAMMDGAPAPAKRVQFFHATHSPDPIDKNIYLNDNGLKLLGVAIDWCLK